MNEDETVCFCKLLFFFFINECKIVTYNLIMHHFNTREFVVPLQGSDRMGYD